MDTFVQLDDDFRLIASFSDLDIARQRQVSHPVGIIRRASVTASVGVVAAEVGNELSPRSHRFSIVEKVFAI